ncbi:MAG: energy transducer TonB [Methylococcaceae bacterium]
MARQTTFDATSYLSDRDSLLITLFVAAILHLIIILGINFTTPHPEKIRNAIDITLVNTPAKKPPKEAKFLAQDNQVGAGEKSKKPEPQPQKLATKSNSQAKQLKKSAPEESKPKAEKKLVTQQKAEKKIVTAHKSDILNPKETQKRPQLTAETLRQQVTQLGTEIRLNQQNSEQSKIKFVDSVSAHKYLAAQYMKDWEDKVTRTGNNNYPKEAIKKNFSASLTMDVGIKTDGSIYSIRISKSSGNQALDEAAKRIVKMSEPFPPLPAELLKELNVLVISRNWNFADRSGMTTQ